MRGTRWLLLVAIAAILGGIGFTYRAQMRALREQSPARPKPLSPELNSQSDHWHYQVTDHGRVVADIDAVDVRQMKDSSRVELKDVTLKLFNKDDETLNLVKTSAATFFTADERLYSEGDVEITLKLPRQDGPPPEKQPVIIRSSGVNFDTHSGRAETDRPSSFVLPNGDGKSTGAYYDPTAHELYLKHDAELHWNGKGPKPRPMKIETDALTYREDQQEIWLKPWGRLTRGGTRVEGADVVVKLEQETIRKVDANKANGTDVSPDRKLRYSADVLSMDFDDAGEVSKIVGQGNAHLVSTTAASENTVEAGHVEMFFSPGDEQGTLDRVEASAGGVVTSKPVLAKGRPPGETHVLSSQVIDMKMRAGGREIETVLTHAPGRIEFLPNLPSQRRRTIDAERMNIAYGPQNRIETFRATTARTRTEPSEEERKRNRPASVTASRELVAAFDARTGRMASLEQAGDFSYEEGGRKARSGKATMDAERNLIVLDTAARIADSTGTTAADRIRMDQRTGDFTAEGRVESMRLPEKTESKTSSGMLAGDEPLQARARRMESTNRNRRVRYTGEAAMWQGANRVEADAIDVDREQGTLTADGRVVTRLWEQPADAARNKTGGAPVLTVVHAPFLLYTEENRLAVYTGGVTLARPGLDMKGRELHAYLAAAGAESRLERAFADGGVVIVQKSVKSTRTGTAEHCEYYLGEQKAILRGGAPKLVETPGNTTEGAELTYFANDDRLLVNGAPRRPGKSDIIRKRK